MGATTDPRRGPPTRLPLLLWIVVSVAVMIGAIVALAEVDDVWTVAIGIAAAGATMTTIVVAVRDELADTGDEPAAVDPPPAARRLRVHASVAVLGIVVLATVAIAVRTATSDHQATSTAAATRASAVNTVRDFIVAASVSGNGEAACGYLTTAEQASIGATDGVGCRQALNDGVSSSIRAASDAAARALHAIVSVHGGRATVRFGTGAGAATFVLERATAAEQTQFNEAASIWRIADGATVALHGRAEPG
jgi:plasmid replication initiation protein